MNDHIAKLIVVDEMFATLARWVEPTRSLAARADRPSSEAVHLPKGIDKRCGLDNVGGDDVLYRRMLGLFRESESDFVRRFHAARNAGDVEAAMRAVHGLKGETETLGMHGLEQASAALEQGCSDRARDADIDAMVQEVSEKLAKIIDEIRALDGASAT